MKNVAILTLFNNNNNYGGALQAFALHKKVKELGFNADVLYYSNGKNPVYPSTKEQLKQYGVIDILKKVTEKTQAKIFKGKICSIKELCALIMAMLELELLFLTFCKQLPVRIPLILERL